MRSIRASLILVAVVTGAVAAAACGGGHPGARPVVPGPSGSLDPSFGKGGLVMTTALLYSSIVDVAVQPDGKIVAMGNATDANDVSYVALARYLADGRLDKSFGSGGIALHHFEPAGPGGNEGIFHAVLAPDGTIVGAGITGTSGVFTIFRFTSTGALDASFGDGGVATVDFPGSTLSFARSARVLPDGKIVATGLVDDPTPPVGLDYVPIVRLLADGSLDTTFGNGGIALSQPIPFELAHDLAIATDGTILAAGEADDPNISDPMLAQFTATGAQDPQFGGGSGQVLLPQFHVVNNQEEVWFEGVDFDTRGAITFGQRYWFDTSGHGRYSVVGGRFDRTGALDTAYGLGLWPGGAVDASFGALEIGADAVKLDASNRAVLALQYCTTLANDSCHPALLRLDPDGVPDMTFGTAGNGLTIGAKPGLFNAQAVAFDSLGRIVVGVNGSERWYLLRYWP